MTHRKESIENVTALSNELAKEQWLDIFEENNVNTAYEKFINKLKHYHDKNPGGGGTFIVEGGRDAPLDRL